MVTQLMHIPETFSKIHSVTCLIKKNKDKIAFYSNLTLKKKPEVDVQLKQIRKQCMTRSGFNLLNVTRFVQYALFMIDHCTIAVFYIINIHDRDPVNI